MPYISCFSKVKQVVYLETGLVFGGNFSLDAADGEFQRVGFGGSLELIPFGNSVFVYGAYLEGISCFGGKCVKQQLGIFNRGVNHAVQLYFVEIGVRHFAPAWFQRISFCVFGCHFRLRSRQDA